MELDLRNARIVLVDDQPQNVTLLERLLAKSDYSNVVGLTDPREAIALFEREIPDLILLDLDMPHLDGFQVMERLQTIVDPDDHVPVLVLTGDRSPVAKQKALSVGATDFLAKPFDGIEVSLRIQNLLRIRFLHRQALNQNAVLEDKVRERTQDLWGAITRLEQTQQQLRVSHEETIHRLSIAAEYRDEDTPRHVYRMSRYCAVLAAGAGETEERTEQIRIASQMHDVGKIALPDRILLSHRRLTPEDVAVMQTHTTVGHEILEGTPSPLGELGASVAWTHHERFDGSGYPRGLKGEDIPIEGRIAAIADVFDAVTNHRPYRKAFPVMEAIEMLREGKGTHFDPDLIDVFFSAMDQILSIKEEVDRSSTPSPVGPKS